MPDDEASEWIVAISTDSLADDDATRITHNGLCIAIFHVGGEFYATAGICTHEHAYLSEGYIDGETVECPLHQGMFNIRTGKALSPPVTTDLRTFETKVENGHLHVRVDTAAV